MTAELYLLAWTALIFYVVGQIWFCQRVVYPLFEKVGAAEYTTYHGFYSARIPPVVIVPGFLSFLLPIPLYFFGPEAPLWMHATNIAGGLVALAVTVGWEIPRHLALVKTRDAKMIAELIRFNWPRTIALTVQAFATLALWGHVLKS